MTTKPLLVRPKREVLTDKGTVWESLLMGKGWNNLPRDQQVGEVVAAFTDGTIDVHFGAINYTAQGIFTDEVVAA